MVKLEVGAYYIRRDGQLSGCLIRVTATPGMLWFFDPLHLNSYEPSGRRRLDGVQSPGDLVSAAPPLLLLLMAVHYVY